MAANALEQAYAQNRGSRKSWFLPTDSIDPTAADDYFVYVRNDGAKPIVVHRAAYESTVAGTLEVHAVTGTAGGSPTARTPVNMTPHAGPKPDITFSDDPDITGLTSQGIVDFIALDAAGEEVRHDYQEGIRLETGQAIALLWDTATGILTGGLHIHEEP